jgi:hypothetical protein
MSVRRKEDCQAKSGKRRLTARGDRMANWDHLLFMSARQQIVTLLPGDNNGNTVYLLTQGEEDDESEDKENEVKTYVQRLCTEGFTVSRTSYDHLKRETLESESQWDSIHKE